MQHWFFMHDTGYPTQCYPSSHELEAALPKGVSGWMCRVTVKDGEVSVVRSARLG